MVYLFVFVYCCGRDVVIRPGGDRRGIVAGGEEDELGPPLGQEVGMHFHWQFGVEG